MLHQEAKLVDIQAKLVSEKKLKKRQKKKARSTQAMIFGIWETYSLGDMSTDELLNKLIRVYGH